MASQLRDDEAKTLQMQIRNLIIKTDFEVERLVLCHVDVAEVKLSSEL
jgi:hypothetical protein